MQKKVVILPCSGIGKAYGEMGRQAIYELIEDFGRKRSPPPAWPV